MRDAKRSANGRKGAKASPWSKWNPRAIGRQDIMTKDQRAIVIKKIMKEKAQ